MEKQKKGVRLEHISKIYTDPKTGKEFYAVHKINSQRYVVYVHDCKCSKRKRQNIAFLS